VNYSNKIGKVSLMAGLRAEQTNAKGNGKSTLMISNFEKTTLILFPQLLLTYQADSKKILHLTLHVV